MESKNRRQASAPTAPEVAHSSVARDTLRAFPVKEGFQRLGLSTTRGYGLIKTGQLSTYRLGARRYVTATALAEFLERSSVSQEPAAARAARVAHATQASLRRRGKAA